MFQDHSDSLLLPNSVTPARRRSRARTFATLPSTALQRTVEDQLTAALDLYRKEVEERRWYGFSDYGDIIHAYDPARHVWRYDSGGYAWDNPELGTDMWLWYSFSVPGAPTSIAWRRP